MRLKNLFWFLLVVVSSGLFRRLSAQQPGTPQPGTPAASSVAAQDPTYSFTVSSRLVLLDVVVTDKQGNLVTNLTKDDFEVFEDKQLQVIRSLDPPFSQTPPRTLAVSSTEDLDRFAPNAPVTVLVLDEIHANYGALVETYLKQYLEAQGKTLQTPTMLIAVGGRGVMMLRDYTTSPKELLTAVRQHYAGSYWIPQLGNDYARQLNQSLLALIQVAKATSGHPGHKSVVWVGRGFGQITKATLIDPSDELGRAVRTCTNVLKDARITLSTLDPAGVGGGRTGLTGSDTQPGLTEEASDAQSGITGETNSAAYHFHGAQSRNPFASEVSFDDIAYASGGRAYYGRNDLNAMIQTSVQNGAGFYTLSYRPTTPSTDPKEFRAIRVKLKNPELRATFREGYFPAWKTSIAARTEDGKLVRNFVMDITLASRGTLVYDGVPMKIVRDGTSDRFAIKLLASDLDWTNSEGQTAVAAAVATAELTLVTESYDAGGKLLSHMARTLKLHTPAPADGSRPAGVLEVPAEVATSAPVARLRFVVRSNGSGLIGADNVFLVDPKMLHDPAIGLSAVHSPVH